MILSLISQNQLTLVLWTRYMICKRTWAIIFWAKSKPGNLSEAIKTSFFTRNWSLVSWALSLKLQTVTHIKSVNRQECLIVWVVDSVKLNHVEITTLIEIIFGMTVHKITSISCITVRESSVHKEEGIKTIIHWSSNSRSDHK